MHNRRTIAKQYLRGRNQQDIAKMVNLTQQTVSKEIASLKEQWIASTQIDFDEAQGAALNKIDDLEEEAIRQYERSRKSRKVIVHKKEPRVSPDPDKPAQVDDQGNVLAPALVEYVTTEISERTESSITKDVRWHDQIMKCVDMRLKVLGLYKQSEKGGGIDGALVPISIAHESTKSKMALLLAVFKEWDTGNTGS